MYFLYSVNLFFKTSSGFSSSISSSSPELEYKSLRLYKSVLYVPFKLLSKTTTFAISLIPLNSKLLSSSYKPGDKLGLTTIPTLNNFIENMIDSYSLFYITSAKVYCFS